MDQKRFDAFSRSLAGRSTRRHAVRQAGAGGLLGGVVASLGLRASAAQDGAVVCTLQFSAVVAIGPDIDTAYEGTLTLEVGPEGAIDNGTFETPGGATYDVVGTATGRALDLRIELGTNQVLTLNGAGENDIILCRGQVDGTFGGPQSEDLGTWTTNAVS
jgi:hypothetical protein